MKNIVNFDFTTTQMSKQSIPAFKITVHDKDGIVGIYIDYELINCVRAAWNSCGRPDTWAFKGAGQYKPVPKTYKTFCEHVAKMYHTEDTVK